MSAREPSAKAAVSVSLNPAARIANFIVESINRVRDSASFSIQASDSAVNWSKSSPSHATDISTAGAKSTLIKPGSAPGRYRNGVPVTARDDLVRFAKNCLHVIGAAYAVPEINTMAAVANKIVFMDLAFDAKRPPSR